MVSDQGQVLSLPNRARRSSAILKPGADRTGHLYVNLHRNSHPTRMYVHTLVLEAFVGPRPDGLLGLHADDDPSNNALQNLRWGTQSQNILDCVANGNHNYARRTHCDLGHPLAGSNVGDRAGSGRRCLECARASKRAWRQSRRDAGLRVT